MPKQKCPTGKFPYSSRIKAMSRYGVKARIVHCKKCNGFHV